MATNMSGSETKTDDETLSLSDETLEVEGTRANQRRKTDETGYGLRLKSRSKMHRTNLVTKVLNLVRYKRKDRPIQLNCSPTIYNIENLGNMSVNQQQSKCAEDCQHVKDSPEFTYAKKAAEVGIQQMNRLFVHTGVVAKIIEILELQQIVVITGKCGDGKTFSALNVLDAISKEKVLNFGNGWTPVIITSPEQWVRVVGEMGTSIKLIVLINDFLGCANLNINDKNNWEKQFESMINIIEDGRLLLLLTSRSHIFDDAKCSLKSYSLKNLFSENAIVNLRKTLPTRLEKENILVKHLKSKAKYSIDETKRANSISKETIKSIAAINTILGYPLLCSQFVAFKSNFKEGASFFSKSRSLLVDFVLELSKSDKTKYAALLYIVLKNKLRLDQLTTHIFEDDQMLKEVATHYGLSNIAPNLIIDALNSLEGVLVHKNVWENYFTFSHSSVRDAVIIVLGMNLPSSIITLSELDFLLEIVRTNKTCKKKGEITIDLVSKSDMELLARRFIADMKKNLVHIMSHRAFADPKFLAIFVSVFEENDVKTLVAGPTGIGFVFYACLGGNLDLIKFLVNEGAAVKDYYNNKTPLHAASLNGHLEVVEFLVKNKSDVMAQSINKWTPLHSASQNGHLTVVEFLVKNKSDVMAQDDKKWTPLHYASDNGHLDVVEFLKKNKSEARC